MIAAKEAQAELTATTTHLQLHDMAATTVSSPLPSIGVREGRRLGPQLEVYHYDDALQTAMVLAPFPSGKGP